MEKIKKVVITFCFIVVCLISIAGCCGHQTVTDGSILEHQQRVSELERTIDSLTSRLGQYDTLIERTLERLEVIRGRAESITDSIRRLEYLFNEYQSIVFELLNTIERIQSEAWRE